MTIHLGRMSPCASRDQPGRRAGNTPCPALRPGAPSLFGLAPGGACRATPVARGAVRSCRTLSPLPGRSPRPRRAPTRTRRRTGQPGGLLSVALSLRFAPAHPRAEECAGDFPRRALPGTLFPWSPDFPPGRSENCAPRTPRRSSGRPACSHVGVSRCFINAHPASSTMAATARACASTRAQGTSDTSCGRKRRRKARTTARVRAHASPEMGTP